MTTNASWQLQQALYLALTTNTTLITLLGGSKIYDFVPQSTKPPYVTIGMTEERDWSTDTETGHEHIITLHSWTKNKGRKEAEEIRAACQDVIKTAPLTMSNYRAVNLTYQFSEIRREREGDTLHTIIRYRIKTEPI